MTKDNISTVGKRKCAMAMIQIRPGSGKVKVKGGDFESYFFSESQRKCILSPLEKLQLSKNYDIAIFPKGGGIESQAQAARLAISKALVKEDESRKQLLKQYSFLTRDPRKKERKKYGQRGARAKFQFSKR